MAEVVNGRLLTAEARFQSRFKSCLVYGGKIGTERGFPKSTIVILPVFPSHSSIHPSPRCIIPEIDSVFKEHTK